MSDAERDAWLREALRHAPDSGALPPSDVSEAILAEARAAAACQGPTARPRASRSAPRHPLLGLWDWLARPPVAAGFASVMAATLVGLMWWDRPMDETLPRRPDAVGERATTTPPHEAAAPTPPAAPTQPATPRENSEPTSHAAARAAPPAADEKRKVGDTLAKERAAPVLGPGAARPSPFPAADSERADAAAAPAFAARKDTGASVAQDRELDAAAPAFAARKDTEASVAPERERDAAKSEQAAGLVRPQVRTPAAGALPDARERQASAFAGQSAARTADEPAAATGADADTAAAPLAAIVGSFASEPERWSRAAADGSAVALEAGWRDWLMQLDAVAGGRWHRVGTTSASGATTADRDGTTTLRLRAAGRPDAVVRLDGTTAHVDAGAPGERWQATLPAAAAERLRHAAENLPR